MITVKNYQAETYPVLKDAINSANAMLKKYGKLTDTIEENLNKAFEACGVFNPKKATRLSYLYKKAIKTDEEMQEFEILSDEEKEFQNTFYAKDLEEVIKADFGLPCDLKYSSLFKVNGKTVKEYTKYSLPFAFLKDFKTDKGYPTSIGNILVTKEELECTKTFAYRVNILSIIYDQIKKEYTRHLWRAVFEPVEKTINATNALTEFESDEDDLL